MLLSLVENAIKHGLNPLPEGGRIRITAETVGGRLRIAVADTGAGVRSGCGSGVGLSNIRARLATLFGPRAGSPCETMRRKARSLRSKFRSNAPRVLPMMERPRRELRTTPRQRKRSTPPPR
jgi:LytS/YehU family sensor histidine kinase